MSFQEAIAKDRGQPATVRVGTVVGVNPVVITVQGTEFEDVGFLNGAPLAIGATVAILGQSSISADGSSWLALGGISPVTLAPAEAVAIPSYNVTSLTYTVAGPVAFCSVAFIVPPSGMVILHWSAEINHGTNFCLLAPQIATGPGPGTGTVVVAASDDVTVRNDASAVCRTASSELVSGLTPGQQLNVTLYHRVGGGTGTIGRRRVMVVPV